MKKIFFLFFILFISSLIFFTPAGVKALQMPGGMNWSWSSDGCSGIFNKKLPSITIPSNAIAGSVSVDSSPYVVYSTLCGYSPNNRTNISSNISYNGPGGTVSPQTSTCYMSIMQNGCVQDYYSGHISYSYTVESPACSTTENQCSPGTANNFSENSSAWSWYCSLGGSSIPCSKQKSGGGGGGGGGGLTPQCGQAAKLSSGGVYSVSETDFVSGPSGPYFCLNSNLNNNPGRPQFPSYGGSATWVCGGGSSAVTCNVTRAQQVISNYTLTVNNTNQSAGNVFEEINWGSINCGSNCSHSYSQNTNIRLAPQVINSNYQFSGWGGDCSGQEKCSLTMNSNKNVTASWTGYSTYTLYVLKKGTGTGTVTGSGINCGSVCTAYPAAGSIVTLNPVASANSEFAGWSGQCDANGQAYMDVTKTCTATFNLKSAPVVECGAARRNYEAVETNFSGSFCTAGGTPSPASPSFPGQGSSVSWTCGIYTCVASRSSPLPRPDTAPIVEELSVPCNPADSATLRWRITNNTGVNGYIIYKNGSLFKYLYIGLDHLPNPPIWNVGKVRLNDWFEITSINFNNEQSPRSNRVYVTAATQNLATIYLDEIFNGNVLEPNHDYELKGRITAPGITNPAAQYKKVNTADVWRNVSYTSSLLSNLGQFSALFRTGTTSDIVRIKVAANPNICLAQTVKGQSYTIDGDPTCGAAAGDYSSGATTFRSPFCVNSSLLSLPPQFPGIGGGVTWICSNAGQTKTIECAANVAQEIINATCGTSGPNTCSYGAILENESVSGGTYYWDCMSPNMGGNALGCSYTPPPAPPTCKIEMTPKYESVNLNVNTAWKLTLPSNCLDCVPQWKVHDSNGDTFPSSVRNSDGTYTLNKTFTSVGLKSISADYPASSAVTIGGTCPAATTTVVRSGGSVGEI